MNEALGKKPPKLCTDMPNCDCKDGEHYRKSLLELANEIKEVNYKFISKTFLISGEMPSPEIVFSFSFFAFLISLSNNFVI